MTTRGGVFLLLVLLFAGAVPVFSADWADVVAPLAKSVLRLTSASADEGEGSCSAIVINAAEGYVLTAAHCVTDTVALAVDGRHAEVAVSNRLLDLAVLKTKLRKGVVTLLLAPADPRLGSSVAVLGFPFGARSLTLQVGVVANPDEDDRLWVNADLLPGDSGGAILNPAGELVGVTSAYRYAGAAHMGLAIPLETVRTFVEAYLPLPAAKANGS